MSYLRRSQGEIPQGSLASQVIVQLMTGTSERSCPMSDFTEVAKIGELKSGAIKAASVGEPQVLLARVGHKYCAVDFPR